MDDQFKNIRYRILELFMYQSTRDFSIRGIARQLKLSHVTVMNHINELIDLKLIRKKEETLYPTYYANTESKKFRMYKVRAIVFTIEKSGLIEYIRGKTLPSSIILFGSCAKGNYTEKSDIDIFIEASKTKLGLEKYEKKIKRSINIIFEKNISNLSHELKNNIVNGVILDGFIRV